MKKTTPEDLIAYGVHLGHKSFKVHPRSRQYIYQIESGTSIIDLFQTAQLLEKAKQVAFELGQNGKVLLVVASKKQTRDIIAELCKKNNIPYLTNKWVGGFLTNFSAISQNIKKMATLAADRDNGDWNQFVKHERVALEKKLNRISGIYEGVASMEKTPDALFVVDIKKENNAILEARMEHIPTIAMVDTNTNPDLVDYPIPANDDAISSVTFIADEIIGAYVEGKETPKKEEKVEKTKSEVLSRKSKVSKKSQVENK